MKSRMAREKDTTNVVAIVDAGEGGGSGSSERAYKKLKQKKIPQRGLGVAQLEKLRLEEQQRSLQSCSSVVNVSSGISPTFSSEMYFQMEPPSNQSYYSNNYTPYWPEEEKMAVLKRTYPFPLEIPPSSSSHSRGSSSSGRTIAGKDLMDYDFGFLTLAPPATTHANQELPGTTEVFKIGGSTSGSYEQQPFFCFLPTPNLENSQSEVGRTVDLNLKLQRGGYILFGQYGLTISCGVLFLYSYVVS